MTAAMVAEFPEEDFGWMTDHDSPVYTALVAAGWPLVECAGAGILGRVSGVLVQRHLDGSGWVMHWSGAMTCLPAGLLADQPTSGSAVALRAWEPLNLHQLSDSQVKVLCVIGRAIPTGFVGRDVRSEAWGVGAIDEEIANATGLAVSTVQHLRADLVHKCLVIDKQGPYARRESKGGARTQVWVVTGAGHDALCPPAPSTDLLTAQLDRQVAAPG